MNKKSLNRPLLVISLVTVGLLYIGCGKRVPGNSSEKKEVAEKNKQDREKKQTEQKGKKKKDLDPSEFPVYEIEYPGTRDQLKKFEWIGEKLDLIEKNLNPHKLKLILPGGAKLQSISRYTSLNVEENGINWITIHPLLEGVTYKEAADKMIDRINKWNVQLLENEKKELEEIKDLKERKPRRKPAMISRTSLKGKVEEDDQYTLTFKLIGTQGRNGWFYNITFHLEQPLRDEIKGRKKPKYKIKIVNVADKKEDTYEYINQDYTLSVEIRDEQGDPVYSEDPVISLFTGYLVYIPRGRSHIEIPKVPENGEIHIQIKPDMKKENKTMEDYKYLPLDKTISGKNLTEGQTIHLKLKKNPDYKGK